MKRTDLERWEREYKRKQKQAEIENRRGVNKDHITESSLINDLFRLYKYDNEKIYNTQTDDNILELLFVMKEAIPENKWENILRKSIKKTKITEKELALKELKEMLA